MKSRNLLWNLRASVPNSCAENFVTEALAWILSTHDELGEFFLRQVPAVPLNCKNKSLDCLPDCSIEKCTLSWKACNRVSKE